MNKTLFYFLITLVGLVTLSLIWFPVLDKSETADSATPANGLVGNTTEEAVGNPQDTADVAPAAADTQEAPAAPSDALAPAPADTAPAEAAAPAADAVAPADEATATTPAAEDVPAGAEVSGDAVAPAMDAAVDAAADAAQKAAEDAAVPQAQ